MMSTVTWLHLSDIHFHPSSEWHNSPTRDALLAFLKDKFANDPDLKPDFISCTGDIAFGQTSSSPLDDQYKQARVFFKQLLLCCGDGDKPLDKKRLFLVPGNHDINRKMVSKFAQMSLNTMAEDSPANIKEINQGFADLNMDIQGAMNRLAEYNQFIQSYLPHQHDKAGRCFYARTITVNDIDIGIAGFNSAWSCAGEEDDRHLWLAGQWQFNQAQTALKSTHLRLGLIHHPIDWLALAERDVATKRLEGEFDFLLHGHTHNAWVDAGQNLTTLAAGATGADNSEEFGFNITRLDLVKGEGKTHLYTYAPNHNDWLIAPVPKHAPEGIWRFKLPESLIIIPQAEPEEEPEEAPETPPLRVHVKQKLYGRDKLLTQAERYLQHNHSLLVYGMRGNGKSVFIEALSEQAPLQLCEPIRLTVSADTTADSLYQQFASILSDSRETIKAPTGTVEEIFEQLKRHYREVKAHWVWLENAHLLFFADSFKDNNLRKLLLALRQLLPDWYWIFELREKPVQGLVVNSEVLEMPGLDKPSLAEFLAAEAGDNQSGWLYKGSQLKSIYQWLGGGHGQQAHPLATRLLIEVAKGRAETPYEVLQRRKEFMEQEIEDFLLGDLYHKVLNADERQLFCCLALYRVAIPHDHIEQLEQKMQLNNSWDGLERRCLLAADTSGDKFYLHGFVIGWLRQLQGYPVDEVAYERSGLDASISAEVIEKQGFIAGCWTESIKGKKRATVVNITRANQGLFHLLAGGQSEGLDLIAAELLGGHLENAFEQVYNLCMYLHNNKGRPSELRAVLAFLIKLKPKEAKLYRFMASSWRSDYGWQDKRVLDNFKEALDLSIDRAENWSSYGRACLVQGKSAQFLAELADYEQSSAAPAGIDDVVLSVKADCLKAGGDETGAMALRQTQIDTAIKDPVIYADQAKAYLAQNNPEQALKVLELAEKNGAANDYTENIKAHIFEQSGSTEEAMALRQQLIDKGSNNATFYADHAQTLLKQNQSEKALAVLQLAENNGAADDHTKNIKAHVLEQLGRTDEAMALRQQLIDKGSNNPTFYNDQAQALLKQNQPDKALAVLQLAENNGAADDHTKNIKAHVLEQLGRTDEAMALRQQLIDIGSKNPAIYADQALAWSKQNQPEKALAVLQLAEKNGAANEVTRHIQNKISRR